MAKRGRPPKPTALKLLQGNPGKRPLKKDEEPPAPIPTPTAGTYPAPTWLSPQAKAFWKRKAPGLMAVGRLAFDDLEAFEMLCTAYGDWREARAKISTPGKRVATTPNGHQQPSCWVSMARAAKKEYYEGCKKFGLTPEDRAGMNGSPTPQNTAGTGSTNPNVGFVLARAGLRT